jgi:hypothetical protein
MAKTAVRAARIVYNVMRHFGSRECSGLVSLFGIGVYPHERSIGSLG